MTECGNYVVGYFLSTVKSVVTVLQIVAPIALIISLIISFSKLVISPENDKKGLRGIAFKCMGIVIFFFLPWIIELALNTFVLESENDGALYLLGSCWKYSSEIKEALDNAEDKGVGNGTTNTQFGSLSTDKLSQAVATGKGMGPVKSIHIDYNPHDKSGKCGKGLNDFCASIATVEYEKGTVKYYTGNQTNSGLLPGSCRAHALTSVINAIKKTNMSTLDLQNYMYKLTPNSGVLIGKKLDKAIQHYNIKATVYHSELQPKKAAQIIRNAVKNGQPVMVFVQNKSCSDLAGISNHHAHIILNIDKNDHVVMVDSCNKKLYGSEEWVNKQAGIKKHVSYKERTPEELVQCLSSKGVSDSYYRLILFEFD